MDAKQFYKLHLERLTLKEKLELLQLLMQSTLAGLKVYDEEKSISPEEYPGDQNLTSFQKILLEGEVMNDEDYKLYKEKKESFAQWK